MDQFNRASELGRRIAAAVLQQKQWPEEIACWGAEHAANRETLDRLGSPGGLADSLRRFRSVDVEKARAEFRRRIAERRRVRIRRRVAAMGAAAAILILAGVYLLQVPAGVVPNAAPQVILADGSTLVLEPGVSPVSPDKGTIVNNSESKTLDYSATAEKTEASGVQQVAYHTLVMPVGADYRIRLADGSQVHLNCVSRLRYPVTFEEDIRKVYLEGEAFFEVAHDSKPFIVCVNGVEVRVHGTKFNVNAREEHRVRAVLTEGLIEIGAESKPGVMVYPGQQADYDVVSHRCTVTAVDPNEASGWQANEIYFRDRPLGEIMSELEVWYGVEVSYGDPLLAEERFTLMIPRYRKLSEVLRLLEQSSDIRFREGHGQVRINVR